MVCLLAGGVLARDGEAAKGTTGRLIGAVRLTLAPRSAAPASVYTRRAAGVRSVPRPADIHGVLVYLSGVRPPVAPPAQHAVLTQEGEQFLPHVVAVTVGSTVEFPNQDPFFHNVFSLSAPASFDLGRYQPGESRSHRFTAPGLVKVYCHIHAQMSALVRVFEHPWFTAPAGDGTFAIGDVPAGDHTVVAWHERIGEQRAQVTVGAGQAVTVDFTLPVLEPER